MVVARGNFERLKVDFRVTFDSKNRVAGFFIQPGTEWTPPSNARPDSYVEEEAIVDAGGWPLEATITVPRKGAPFAAVVLVQGSGPSDRDESIGPNKVFADLASALASRGVAVIRYEKRTRTYASKLSESLGTFGVREETVDDAVAALALLASDPRIDRKGLFILGHSLGAMLGPMIAEAAMGKGISPAGLILVAPNARPLEDLIYDQVRYLARIDGNQSSEETARLEGLKLAGQKVKTLSPVPSLADPRAEELPLGLSAAYWRSLAGYDPVARAAGLDQRLLVLHGGRDYQVMASEAKLWREGLSGKRNKRTLLLPGLNHLMMKGSGVPSPAEYELPGHVDEAVPRVIAEFVLSPR